jgi:hypothetical protein
MSNAGHWWLEAKTYMHSRPPAQWTNRSECYGAAEAFRFENPRDSPLFDAAERTFELQARPRIDLKERERRALAVRSFEKDSERALGPCFLASLELIELVQRVNPRALIHAPIEQRVHGRSVDSSYLLCDVAAAFLAIDVIDRTASEVTFEVGFARADARPYWRFKVDATSREKIHFKPERLAGRAAFGLVLGTSTKSYRVVVSDALAQAIFAARLPGVVLTHTARDRAAPDYYRPHTTLGWEALYPH